MWNDDGTVAIDGFYDDVIPLTTAATGGDRRCSCGR